jgi:hypothetical protein
MLIFSTSFVNELGHGDIDIGSYCGVVPVESHTKIVVTGPILGELDICPESRDEMFSVSF